MIEHRYYPDRGWWWKWAYAAIVLTGGPLLFYYLIWVQP